MESQYGPAPGCRVLIIGGAHGIGRALAGELAGQGVELILADYDGPALHEAARTLGAHGIFCDVLSQASVDVFCAYLEQRFDSIDMLINAAGKHYVRTLGMVRASVAILPMLRRSECGRHILNVATADHFDTAASAFAYASSKESFFRCSEALSERGKSSSISVSAIICGDNDADDYNLDRLARHVSQLVDPIAGFRHSRRDGCAGGGIQ